MKQNQAYLWRSPRLWVGGLAVVLVWAVLHVAASSFLADGLRLVDGARTPKAPVMAVQLPSPAVAPQSAPVDCAVAACLALSFDDGPHPVYTPQILSILKHANVRASFFVVGSRVPGNKQILRQMHADGHEVGNHTWGHADLTKLPPDQVHDQVTRTQLAVMNAGLPAPRLLRPPYGAVNDVVRAQVPLTIALWNIDPEDWKATDPAKLIDYVDAHAKPGGVIDMHDIQGATVQALGPLLERLKARYQLVTVSELFDLTPGQRGEYFGR